MVVQWDEYYSGLAEDMELEQFAIQNVLEDLIGKTGTIFLIRKRTLGLVLYGTWNELCDEAMQRFETFLRSCLAKYAKVRVRIGTGSPLKTFLDLNKSITAALRAAESAAEPGEPGTHPFVEEAKAMLQRNCGDGVCLKTIAKQLYVNPAYLGRLFKTYETVTFNEYLIQIRIEKAKELLKTTDMRIYEIANEVGYRQLDWFYKKFKAYTGCSAKEFKIKRM
jgi:AraC-like DNA-binding protein